MTSWFIGAIPINLQIGHMRIKRNELGIFEIQPTDGVQINSNAITVPETEKSKRDKERELISLQLVMQQLKLDNDSMKKQLNSLAQSNEAHTWVKNLCDTRIAISLMKLKLCICQWFWWNVTFAGVKHVRKVTCWNHIWRRLKMILLVCWMKSGNFWTPFGTSKYVFFETALFEGLSVMYFSFVISATIGVKGSQLHWRWK